MALQMGALPVPFWVLVEWYDPRGPLLATMNPAMIYDGDKLASAASNY